MRTRRELEELSKPNNREEEWRYKINISKKQMYYGRLKKEYPYHLTSFIHMHRRSKQNEYDKEFSRTIEGFINFILYLGDVPENMKQPTIGRLNHTLGYFKNNFIWQSHGDNTREMITRTNLLPIMQSHTINFKKHTKLKNVLKSLKGKIYLKKLNEIVQYSRMEHLERALKRCSNYMIYSINTNSSKRNYYNEAYIIID